MAVKHTSQFYKVNHILMFIIFIFFINIYGFARDKEHIVIGHKIKIQSKILEKEMQLSIHIPDEYETSDEKYPVLFTFQTHFEQVSGTIKNLYDYNLVPKIIVVRIDNYEFGYLTPTKIESNPNSGKADLFLQFFKAELIPFINKK